MQKSKIKWPIIIIVIGLIIMYFGGKTMIEDKAMRDFVHSKVATEAIWDTINGLEDNHTGGKRVVKKFTIAKDGIERNPWNGYSVEIYLNGDKEITMGIGLRNFGTPNKTWEADPSPGPKASKLLKMED